MATRPLIPLRFRPAFLLLASWVGLVGAASGARAEVGGPGAGGDRAAKAYKIEMEFGRPEGKPGERPAVLKEGGAALHVHKGFQGAVRWVVVPNADAHVSPGAPVSLTVSSGGSLQLARQNFGRPEARETAAKGVSFSVPFVAAAAGKDEIKGKLVFFICTQDLCERQQRLVSLPVVVE